MLPLVFLQRSGGFIGSPPLSSALFLPLSRCSNQALSATVLLLFSIGRTTPLRLHLASRQSSVLATTMGSAAGVLQQFAGSSTLLTDSVRSSFGYPGASSALPGEHASNGQPTGRLNYRRETSDLHFDSAPFEGTSIPAHDLCSAIVFA